MVEAAVEAGALGARMTGGGFGGSAIVLVEAEDADRVAKAVEEAFVAAGSRRTPGVRGGAFGGGAAGSVTAG